MKEQLISFDTAKLAKEKGFEIRCRYYYTEEGMRKDSASTALNWYSQDGHCYSPTQSLLQKWLRDEHNIHLESSLTMGLNYAFMVYNQLEETFATNVNSYEEALEEGLKKALTLIK